MKTKRYAIALLLGLLLVLIGSWAKRRLLPSDWEKCQRAYNALRREAGMPPVDIGVRSIRVGGRDERCVSCHLGTILPALPTPPFQSHPAVVCALPISRQGCTGCHGGEPLRLSTQGAHGVAADTRRTLTDGPDRGLRSLRIQAGCAGCHLRRDGGVLRYDGDKVPEVAAGLTLFLSQGCASCHRVAGVFSAAEHGPALSSIAQARSREAIERILLQPQASNAASPMPPLTLPPADQDKLVTFLLAQVGPDQEQGCSVACAMQAVSARPGPLGHFPDDPSQKPNAATGALWARRIGCAGCHRLSNTEAGVPDLTRVGWYRNEAQLRNMLRDPRKVVPATWMPLLNLPEPVVESLVAWLLLQRVPLPSLPKEVFRDVCRRCHGQDRDAKVVVLSKRPPLLEGRKESLTREKFVEVATRGVDGTAMPPWGRMLSPPFLGAIHESLE
ncbi:MAG: c-type cytochrome [Deltaproteobacteria bacterium]|nr:c-type cytochrome [Deltaproteobacteria bacterium]